MGNSNYLTVPSFPEHIKIIQEQVKLSKKEISSEQFVKYAFDIINPSLREYFKDDFVYHKFFYLDEAKVIKASAFAKIDNNYPNAKIRELAELTVETIEKKLQARDTLGWSLTRQILEKNKDNEIYGILLCRNYEEFIHNEYWSYIKLNNLKFDDVILKGSYLNILNNILVNYRPVRPEIDYQKEFNELIAELGIASDNIMTFTQVIGAYKHLEETVWEKYRKNIFFYFIRPFALHELFDGTLFFCLTRPLSTHEIIQLAEMLTIILQNTVLVEFGELTKKAEWEEVLGNMIHTTRGEVLILQNLFDSFFRNIEVNYLHKDNDNIIKSILIQQANILRKKIQLKLEIETFLLGITKVGGKQEEIIRLHDEPLKKILSISDHPIKLEDKLKEALYFFKDAIELIPTNEDHQQLLLKLIDDVNFSFINDSIFCNELGMEIILKDILKNALNATDANKPLIKCDWIHTIDKKYLNLNFDKNWSNYQYLLNNYKNYGVLEIENNKPIEKSMFEFIAFNKPNEKINRHGKIGIMTIKMIAESEIIMKSKNKCIFQISKKSNIKDNSGSTKILLFIPKQ